MIIALNNKSNLGKSEFILYLEKLKNINTVHDLILCPTSLNISLFSPSDLSLGAQNVSRTDDGAYTGEISAKQLKSFNVEYCIVGHSERREYQKESLEEVSEKVKKLLENGIVPILCIGETKEERLSNQYKEVLEKELNSVINSLNEEEKEKIIVAYEPIWSIGTGLIPNNEEIEEIIDYIKKFLPNNKVLYGGSANDNNIDQLNEVNGIDGYLLGGLSLKPDNLKVFLDKIN